MRWNSIWRETRAFPRRAAYVTKHRLVSKLARPAYHCFTSNAVSPHLPFLPLYAFYSAFSWAGTAWRGEDTTDDEKRRSLQFSGHSESNLATFPLDGASAVACLLMSAVRLFLWCDESCFSTKRNECHIKNNSSSRSLERIDRWFNMKFEWFLRRENARKYWGMMFAYYCSNDIDKLTNTYSRWRQHCMTPKNSPNVRQKWKIHTEHEISKKNGRDYYR